MNAYRSYMTRVTMPKSTHTRLMNTLKNGEKPERQKSHMAQWSAAAACFALLCLGGWGLLRGGGLGVGGDIAPPPVVATATPAPTPIVPPGVKNEYVLSPAETLDTPTKATQVNFEGGRELAASIAMPDGWFEEKLTRTQLVTLLGGEEKDDAPWYLMWSGYDVTGTAVYNGEGKLWRAELQGIARADDKNSFTMTLRPGALPEDCVVENKETTIINGTPVAGSKGQYGWDDSGTMGEVRKLTFMAGDVGVAFSAYNRGGERANSMATSVANCYAGVPVGETLFALTLAGLDPYDREIPQWRSERLTLDKARAEEGFSKYIPAWVPEGFAFESAHRELGQGRDWLRVCWTGYYTDIGISIYRAEFYQKADSDDEPIPVTSLSGELIGQQLEYVGTDSGDVAGYRGRFAVDYMDGFIVEYSFKGVTPEQVAKMLNITGEFTESAEWAWPVPGEYTTSYLFGENVHPLTGKKWNSNGVGIKADKGIDVLAAADGKVHQVGYDDTFGNYVKLGHGDNRFTVYSHVSGKDWKQGDSVKQGEVLGQIDQSGTATGPHLHLEFLRDGEYIDPLEQYVSLNEK